MRRYAQSAALTVRDQHRFDTVAIIHAHNPLSGSVFRRFVMDNFRATNLGYQLELFPQGFAHIGHLIEVIHAALMHPLQQLSGAKTFFPKDSK